MSADRPSSSSVLRSALTAGSAIAGAYAGLAATRWAYQQTLPPPSALPPALDWSTHSLEVPHGRAQLYVRPGTGVPVILLHSFNAAASSAEMAPIADHLAATTDRPLYAVDWLGFGGSDRPDLDYAPDVFGRQLYHVLTDVVDEPADLVALSLGCEYAGWMGLQAAPRVRRLALISPTGLTSERGPSMIGRAGLAIAGRTGVFELLYYRLTRRSSLRDYYERQVFLDADAVPDALVDYAYTTTHVRGAAHAPRRFVEGSLFLDSVGPEIYGRLYRPTLLLSPETPGPTIQRFDQLPNLLDQNPHALTHKTVPGGLMPHWEAPDAFFEALMPFLTGE
ncbi:alpha/beta hydrolase [Salinibacter sp. 10B]|uniref:alpha/beta fold hydrolase n=1 Tax=Salinibacter sp. 10B TaxID=1923971 RepID=UPI000CF3D238|nr:alpha/beta fold hydrolase [Salinibacter sp. 10B]PQJ33817.1 alpha/beta hydrolase [Salinibacter sp. 10B]